MILAAFLTNLLLTSRVSSLWRFLQLLHWSIVKKSPHVLQRLCDELSKATGICGVARAFAGHMEKNIVVRGQHVRNPITIVGNGPKAPAR